MRQLNDTAAVLWAQGGGRNEMHQPLQTNAAIGVSDLGQLYSFIRSQQFVEALLAQSISSDISLASSSSNRAHSPCSQKTLRARFLAADIEELRMALSMNQLPTSAAKSSSGLTDEELLLRNNELSQPS